MWSSDRRTLFCRAAAVSALLAAGCGFEPLYGTGTPARSAQGQVEVATAPDAEGFLLRERLVQLLGSAEAPSHRLDVTVEIVTEGTALTEENFTTRFAVVGVADYRLTPIAGGPAVLANEVRAISGYSAPVSESVSAFASRAAEAAAFERVIRTLAERIAEELALRAGEWAA